MRRRSLWSFLIAGFFALVAVAPQLLAAYQVTVPWAVTVATVIAALAALALGAWQHRYEQDATRRDEQDRALSEGCLTLPSGRLPKVRDFSNPRDWGVHPAATSGATASIPPFVPRDVDEELRTHLATSTFVLVVGDSTAGKTRCAFEAVQAVLPHHTLIIPTTVSGIAAALRAAEQHPKCVLWLNDINTWFSAPELTREAVSRLLAPARRGHRVVVATLRAAEENQWRTIPEDSAVADTHRKVHDLLSRAHRIFLPRLFTPAERERARNYARDQRIADALQQADEYGIAEYLANGPQLLAEWESAWSANTDPQAPSHPRGAALIAAAVDLRRAGYASVLPRRLIEEVHGHYLDQQGGHRLNPEALDDAWQWATRPRRGTTRLLTPHDPDHVDVFDYLVDSVQRRTRAGDHVPEHVITTALTYAAATDAHSIGITAKADGRYRLAEHAHRQAYTTRADEHGPTHPDTLDSRNNLALALHDLGRLEEAETEYRAVLDAHRRILGDNHHRTLAIRSNLASLLQALGHFEKAEAEYHAVLDAHRRILGDNHPHTLTIRSNLASLLQGQGRLVEAAAEYHAVLDAYRRILGDNHPDTLAIRGSLASVLQALGHLEKAEAEHRAVLDIRRRILGDNHPHTLISRNNLASLLQDQGRLVEAAAEHCDVLAIRRRVLGDNHPHTLISLENVASVLQALRLSVEELRGDDSDRNAPECRG
ncbi:MAG: tetratricopeptide repeat protein [Thermobifida fusca]|nr:tetratricopeptide repeat protein [Thermobifida fusca]